MAVLLSICTKEERAVIQFWWAEGVPGADIHHTLSAQYVNNSSPKRCVYKWITMFKNGHTSVTGEERL
jgi:hypothetical protein